MPGVLTVYRWELRKLRSKNAPTWDWERPRRSRSSSLLPWSRRTGVRTTWPLALAAPTGLAIPLVLLLFGSIWMFPLITALVAGDIVAAEDRHDTLKTILTRWQSGRRSSSPRPWQPPATRSWRSPSPARLRWSEAFWPRGSTRSPASLGTRVSASHGLGLVGASLLVYLLPILAIASIAVLLSTVLRNSGAAIVGTLMFSLLLQLFDIVPGLHGLHPYLLSTQFNAWQGFLRTPVDWAPIVRAIWVCALYAVPALAAAGLVFLRRDVASG